MVLLVLVVLPGTVVGIRSTVLPVPHPDARAKVLLVD